MSEEKQVTPSRKRVQEYIDLKAKHKEAIQKAKGLPREILEVAEWLLSYAPRRDSTWQQRVITVALSEVKDKVKWLMAIAEKVEKNDTD